MSLFEYIKINQNWLVRLYLLLQDMQYIEYICFKRYINVKFPVKARPQCKIINAKKVVSPLTDRKIAQNKKNKN